MWVPGLFGQMNNYFNWAHLPSPDMSHNTAFMHLTALLRNFYGKYVEELSKSTGGQIHKQKNYVCASLLLVKVFDSHTYETNFLGYGLYDENHYEKAERKAGREEAAKTVNSVVQGVLDILSLF